MLMLSYPLGLWRLGAETSPCSGVNLLAESPSQQFLLGGVGYLPLFIDPGCVYMVLAFKNGWCLKT